MKQPQRSRAELQPDEPITSEIFPTRLRELRASKGISQEEFAKAIGIARASASYYEQRGNSPNIITLSKIADFFNVSADYLIGRTIPALHDASLQELIREIANRPNVSAMIYDFQAHKAHLINGKEEKGSGMD